ncbi:DUF764 family protein (plasmid) [Borrelia coriaceae]|uniref:Putative cytosolic protein n=1 Tax=Borrelia coriaceae ATCC 43381 TaxID=1408429 RepID=W5SV64_9SPIR|nr:DUF764 family protein [Borrelia coriaceae]AHH11109.1 Putative cytosolic protein [Borrelia coriaceae ATCC 43381]UPA17013.1 DUF764 family protein [Borrelia coriaceae]
MLISLYESQNFLIKIFISFKNYLKQYSLRAEIINSYNRLYLSDLDGNHSYLIVIEPKGFDCLEPRVLRSGSFYSSVNEFGLKFNLFFWGFVGDLDEHKIYVHLYKIYEYFLDFLHDNSYKFKFLKPLEGKYNLSLNYYLKSTGDLVDSGISNISWNAKRAIWGLSQPYRAEIQAIEVES